MDDRAFFLVTRLDEQIRRTSMLIEQHRLNIKSLHPSRRRCEETRLTALTSGYARLLNYRHALTAEPSYDLLH